MELDKLDSVDLYSQFLNCESPSEFQVSKFIEQIARGLLDLHNRNIIIHEELKPENILCNTTGNSTLLELCDVNYRGSLEFMAPELVAGGQGSNSCDLWSLGVIMYTMLVASLPFSGQCGLADCPEQEGNNTLCKLCHDNLCQNILRGFCEDPHITNNISVTAMDLIRGLLVTDPQARLNAADVMKHPFITDKRSLGELRLTKSVAILRESFCIRSGVMPSVFPVHENHLKVRSKKISLVKRIKKFSRGKTSFINKSFKYLIQRNTRSES